MSEWQPISTAPNNVLIVTDGSFCAVGIPVGDHWFMGWCEDDGSQVYKRIYPTHWMHLPDAPITKDAGDE